MKWDTYLAPFAQLAASGSDDIHTHVGCVIADQEGTIRATGYNGFPRGVKHLPERLERPTKYAYMSHAEMSAVGNAARTGVSLKGCTAYVTHHPCDACARLLIQSGVVRVVVTGREQTTMEIGPEAAQMFKESGVVVDV